MLQCPRFSSLLCFSFFGIGALIIKVFDFSIVKITFCYNAMKLGSCPLLVDFQFLDLFRWDSVSLIFAARKSFGPCRIVSDNSATEAAALELDACSVVGFIS